LRKGNGFCVVACVLEADQRDEHALHKAQSEKTVIKSIMDEENIKGFAEVVVAPSWVEGTNYIIQLTGIGGLVPNTVLLDWPNWKKSTKRARDFVEVLSTALAEDKAVLAVKGLTDMPLDGSDQVHGTIDVWWMIHDGGFMILLSWLLVQHRVWRKCHIRVFTVAEGVDAEKAKAAAKMLSKVLKARRLVDVDVEVILADEDMIDPYMHDYTMRVEERHNFLAKLNSTGGDPKRASKFAPKETIPCEIEDLFAMEENGPTGLERRTTSDDEHIVITDERHADDSIKRDSSQQSLHRRDRRSRTKMSSTSNNSDPSQAAVKEADAKDVEAAADAPKSSPTEATLAAAEEVDVTGCANLNNLILSRSKRAQLVVLNLPTVWGTEPAEVKKFMSYCDTLTTGLDRVLFVHSSGHEIFDIHR
jgi:potassium/chloride transporter 4/5/6